MPKKENSIPPMTNLTNRRIVLAARPVGAPKDSDFKLVEEPVGEARMCGVQRVERLADRAGLDLDLSLTGGQRTERGGDADDDGHGRKP